METLSSSSSSSDLREISPLWGVYPCMPALCVFYNALGLSISATSPPRAVRTRQNRPLFVSASLRDRRLRPLGLSPGLTSAERTVRARRRALLWRSPLLFSLVLIFILLAHLSFLILGVTFFFFLCQIFRFLVLGLLFFLVIGMGTDECCSTQLIDGDGEFNAAGLDSFMKTARVAQCGLSYAAVSIMGPQSSGERTFRPRWILSFPFSDQWML